MYFLVYNSKSDFKSIWRFITLFDISVQQFLSMNNAIPVDVRSPEEYEEATIPGAINVPLFNNEERKEIGTIYKQIGPENAKWRAMELISPKLPALLSQIKKLAKDGSIPVLFCWRGGMRSKSVATFMDFAGFSVHRIEGGYRAYREEILDIIPKMIPTHTVVIHGMTGVGKTEILAKLNQNDYPVLDLEGLAGHKGSIFGSMGKETDVNNQKTFDALLFSRLVQLKDSSYVIVEAESKRIGKITQPEELLITKLGGVHFYIEASLNSRVERIYHEYVETFYQEEWFHPQVVEKFSRIQKRIKNVDIKLAMTSSLENQDYKEFIKLLLEFYYDPRYQHKQLDYEGEFIQIATDDSEHAAKIIAGKLDKIFTTPHIHY